MSFRYRPPNRIKRETRWERIARKITAIRKPLLNGATTLALLLLLSAAGYFLFRQSGQDAAETAYARAGEYRKANDFGAARIELLNAVRASPKWPPALIAQAEVALEMFDGETAKLSLERAVRAGSSQSDLAHLLGHALWMTGDNARAETMLMDPKMSNPNRAYAKRILGRLYLDRGDYNTAQAALDDAAKIAPDSSRLWTEIARLRFALADQVGATAASDKAVELDPRDYRALEFRAQMARSQLGLAAALPWFERALAIYPDDIPLLEEYAVTLGEMGRNRDMLLQARQILALNSKNGRAYYMQAVIAARAGNFGLARRTINLAGSTINEMPGAMLLSAIAEYELGNFHKAAEILERLSDLQPLNMQVRRLLARAKQRIGENLDALENIDLLITGGNAGSYDAMLAARSFEAEGELHKAAARLSDAARPTVHSIRPLPESLSLSVAADGAIRNPNDARFVVPYIRALLRANNVALALEQAKKLQMLSPAVADAHMLVGDVEAIGGDYRAATESYERARAIKFSEAILLRLVDGYRRQKRLDEANEQLAAFIYYNPNNLTAQRLTAYLLLDQSRWAEALPLLERLRGRVGYNDSILCANLARAYSGLGRHDEAIFHARAGYRVDPASPMVTLVYAQTLQKAKRRPKAVLELFEKANAMIPENPVAVNGLKLARANYRRKKAK